MSQYPIRDAKRQAEADAMRAEGFTPISVVCLPDAVTTEGKLALVMAECTPELDALVKPRREIIFERKRDMARFGAGHCYELWGKDAKWKVVTARWIGEFKDEKDVAAWQAAQTAAELDRKAEATEKREARSDSTLRLRLEPIRLARSRVPANLRAAFDVYVLQVIRSERP